VCAIVAAIAIGIQGLKYHDPATTTVFFVMGALFAGLGALPALILLRLSKRKKGT